MTTVLFVVLLAALMSLSPRIFVFVVVILGSVVISKFEFWFGATESLGNPIRTMASSIAGMILVTRGLLEGRKVEIPSTLFPYLLLVAYFSMRLPFVDDIPNALRFVNLFLIPLLVFCVTQMYFTIKNHTSILVALLVVCGLQIIVGAIEYVLEPGIRVSGLHDVSAVYGWFVTISIMLAAYLHRQGTTSSPVASLFMIAGSLMVVLTGARIAMLMMPVGLWYFLNQFPSKRLLIVTMLALSLGLAYLVFSFQSEQGFARVGIGGDTDQVEFEGEAGGTITWRLLLWERLLDAWWSKPWAGYGPGADASASLEGGLTADLNYAQSRELNTHNEYIKVLFNGGVIGLLFFLLVFVSFIKKSRSIHGGDSRVTSRLLGYLAVTWALFSITDNGISYHGQTSIFFVLLSLMSKQASLDSPRRHLSRVFSL